ncbi:hypothetical protein D3C71_1010090 [compost metagenome]
MLPEARVIQIPFLRIALQTQEQPSWGSALVMAVQGTGQITQRPDRAVMRPRYFIENSGQAEMVDEGGVVQPLQGETAIELLAFDPAVLASEAVRTHGLAIGRAM